MTLIYSKLYEVFLEYKIRRVLQKTHSNSVGKKYNYDLHQIK